MDWRVLKWRQAIVWELWVSHVVTSSERCRGPKVKGVTWKYHQKSGICSPKINTLVPPARPMVLKLGCLPAPTRMLSSGMRTARLLTVSPSIHGEGCAPASAGGCLPLVPHPPDRHPPLQTPPGKHPLDKHPLPSACWDALPPLWTDRHLWKHNLRKLRLWAEKTYHPHELGRLES